MTLRRLSLLVLLLGLAGTAIAQPPRWSVAALAIWRDIPYRQADSDLLVVPAVQYEGERAYLRGLRLGWRAAGDRTLGLDLIAQARMDGYDAGDSPFLAGMATRQRSLDAGLAGHWRTAAGDLEASVVSDVLGRHRGQAAHLAWAWPVRRGALLLRPELGLRWWSANLVDYYAGVRPEEARPGRPAWRGGNALIAEAALGAVLALDRRWSLFGRLGYERLPSAITDSPLIDRDQAVVGLFGVSYGLR